MVIYLNNSKLAYRRYCAHQLISLSNIGRMRMKFISLLSLSLSLLACCAAANATATPALPQWASEMSIKNHPLGSMEYSASKNAVAIKYTYATYYLNCSSLSGTFIFDDNPFYANPYCYEYSSHYFKFLCPLPENPIVFWYNFEASFGVDFFVRM